MIIERKNITSREWDKLNSIFSFSRGNGYILNFSNTEFSEFMEENFGLDIEDDRYLTHGHSKGKRLFAFCQQEHPQLVARVLRGLFQHFDEIVYPEENIPNFDYDRAKKQYFDVVRKIEILEDAIQTDALSQFKPDITLSELIADIQRDIDAHKPQAAIDRLHTYCMKRTAELARSIGADIGPNDALHSRFGKYRNFLEQKHNLHKTTHRIMKEAVKIFDDFNDVRNNQSLAHDREIIDEDQARFIFESISAILRFVEAVDAQIPKPKAPWK